MEEIVCRLCLGIVTHDFELIEDDTKEIFDIIQLNIDLSLSEEPILCKDCEKNLQLSYDFKSTCMHAEEFVASFASVVGDGILDLKGICVSENEDIGTESDVDFDVCRFCVQYVEKNYCTSLEMVMENVTLARTMLPKCLPEVNLASTKEPVVCSTCVDYLEKYLSFMKTCWDADEKIKEYCTAEGRTSKGQVQLSEVLKNMFDHDSKPVQISEIKAEPVSFVSEEFEQREIKGEHVVKLEDEELHIKSEDKVVEEQHSLDSLQGKKSPSALEADLASSQERVSETTVYHCEKCSYKTKQKQALNKHMLVHKDFSEVKTYQCKHCPYKSKRKADLDRHSIRHQDPSEGRFFECEKCNYKTKIKHCLKQHMKGHHAPSESEVHKCNECTFKSPFKSRLEAHMLIHKDPSEVTMYSCEECNYQSKSKYSLKYHAVKHRNASEITMHKCDTCTFTTKRKSSLRGHYLAHKGIKKAALYQCKMCPYRAVNSSSLRIHTYIYNHRS